MFTKRFILCFSLCCLFLIQASLFLSSAQAAPATAAGSFDIPNIVLNNLNGTKSMLQGSRTYNSSPYSVSFRVSDMGSRGCFNGWVTLLHNDQYHNDALRIFCNHLELHMHNGAGTDFVGPSVDFTMGVNTEHTFLVTVDGQAIRVYDFDSGSGVLLLSWDIPNNEPNISGGRSVVTYAAGGTVACWDAFAGEPGVATAPFGS